MSREEFMKKLEMLLQNLPADERREALQYYEDYFEDAGPDMEAEVVRELVSPEHVAESICKDLNVEQQHDTGQPDRTEDSPAGQSTGYTYQDGLNTNTYNNQGNQGYQQGYQQNYQQGYQGQNMYNYEPVNKKYNIVLLVLLIVTLPITLPVIGSAFATIISFLVGIAACIFAFFASGAAFFVSAVILFSMGLPGIGFILLGIGLLFACLAFLLMPLIGWFCSTLLPAFVTLIKKAVLKLIGKEGNAV